MPLINSSGFLGDDTVRFRDFKCSSTVLPYPTKYREAYHYLSITAVPFWHVLLLSLPLISAWEDWRMGCQTESEKESSSLKLLLVEQFHKETIVIKIEKFPFLNDPTGVLIGPSNYQPLLHWALTRALHSLFSRSAGHEVGSYLQTKSYPYLVVFWQLGDKIN